MCCKMVKKSTKERELSMWNKLQAVNFDLSTLDDITFQEFNKIIGSKAKTNAQYKLAKGIARNIHIQERINKDIERLKLPKYITKPIALKEYIPKYKRVIKVVLNPKLAIAKYHKYYSDIVFKGKPENFDKKYVCAYHFKKKRIKRQGFLDGHHAINNFQEFKHYISFDLPMLNDFFLPYFNSKVLSFSVGYLLEFETFNPKTLKYDSQQIIGQKTVIGVSKMRLRYEQIDKLRMLKERFELLGDLSKETGLQYHIYDSKIMYIFYVPLKQTFDF